MSLISLFPLEIKYLKESFLNISLPGTSRQSKNTFLSGIWQVCAQCRVAREEGGQRREKHLVMKIGCQESLIWTPPLSDFLIMWIIWAPLSDILVMRIPPVGDFRVIK